MPFNSWLDVENRLGNSSPVSSEEIRQLLQWMNQISETGMRRLNAHLVLQNLEAVQKFEKSSSKLANDHPHLVRYIVYGYDQNGRRISQGGDEFAIGKRETVLRNVRLQSEERVFGKIGSTFWIQMALDE